VTDDDLARNVVALRSFAHSLAHGIDADDLVQDVAGPNQSIIKLL
jgi:hypothetical protein